MKKYYVLGMILFFYGFAKGQIINFPDVNFKNKLLSSSATNEIAQDITNNSIAIDSNNNGEIEESEALMVYSLNVSNSNISSLQGLEYFTNLYFLYCNNNLLSDINLSNNINLVFVNCNDNQLTTIDTSFINDLSMGISCNNNNLTSMNLKGIGDGWEIAIQGLTYANNPNLNYICIREIDALNPFSLYNYIQDLNQNYLGYPNCEVNTYCSFNPGGNYYIVQGNSKYDIDNNGCDVADINVPNIKFDLSNGTISGTQIANGTGNYSIPLQAGTHTITPIIENSNYFNIFPNFSTVTFPDSLSPLTQNFCFTPNGEYHDLEVVAFPINNARPGFDANYSIIYKNKGTITENATILFEYDDSILDFISANITPTSQNNGLLTWSIGNINPFEITNPINLTLKLNSPTEIPPLNTGDVLNYTTSINSLNPDETPIDNISYFNQTVVNSFDPNEKICLEGNILNSNLIGEYLHYIIRFENLGTANAQNIVIKDLIDATKFDINSLQIVNSSHQSFTRVYGSKVEFIFENINLPFDNANNDGFIVFKIKTLLTLAVADQINNIASIYFDYNFPIDTNTATSTFQTLINNNFEFRDYFSLYPNPVHNNLYFSKYQDISANFVRFYNNLGQLVLTITNPSNTIDVSSLQAGNYFINIVTDKGVLNSKFIKE